MEPEPTLEAELTFEQKVQMLMSVLPKPVQDFLHSPERDTVAQELSAKYALHVDQAGVFERSYLYMLLGVFTPDEFVQELRDARIPEESIRGLTIDVNERVFKRLQGAERNPPPAAPAPIPPPIPLQPKPFVSTPMAKPFTATAEPKPVPPPPATPIYVPPTAPAAPSPVPSAFTSPASTPAAPVEHPTVRTMAHDMEALKEESKHPHAPQQAFPAHQVPVAPSAWQPASPARTFQTSSVPNTAPVTPAPQPFSPSTAPFALSVPVSAPMPPAARPAPAVPVPPNLPGQPAGTHPADVPPIVKEYSVDPYREVPE
ncbi:MAG TPA: hypothetical protein VGN56_01335 [Candidatus Paceibacterota bacterium]|nr:hypothetical protein [Candidatus Paceibacterota bacterium]